MRIDLPLLCLLPLFSLSACVSTRPAPDAAYYLLASDLPASSSPADLAIESIELADYLNTSSLVVELEDSQFTHARYHRWSEPLRSGIRRVLERQLGHPNEEDTPAYRADLTVDRYHGTIEGEVFLEGRYRLYSKYGDESANSGNFSFRSTLEEDGYPAMVRELSALLDRLAKRLSTARSEAGSPDNQIMAH